MKVLLLDRGFINGPQIGRLKQEHGIDTVIPIRSDMNLQEDVRGLMKLPTVWEEYEPTHRAPLPDATAASHGQPMHPTAKKRERRAEDAGPPASGAFPVGAAPEPSKIREQTLIARFPGLTSWWDCPMPLTGVYSRDLYADGHEDGWLLVTTNADWSARRVRDLYGLRTDIEERHRQVKCFWDLTRFHSTAWSLVVSQTVFVCLTYSLLQIHLLQQGHRGTEPSDLAHEPPPAARWRPRDHLPPAILRVLHAAGAHGHDAEPGRQGPPPRVEKMCRLSHDSLPNPVEPDHT